MIPIATWFLYFIIYAILGWIAETVYCSIPAGHFVERGFLRGPLCPIYGVGALIILWALHPWTQNIAVLFLLGAVLTSILEYLTSFFMEKLFHMRWWDYSAHKFNIKGRVCLLNSTLFGILCVILAALLHPVVVAAVAKLSDTTLYITAGTCFVIFAADFIVSVVATVHLKEHLEKLKEAEEQFREELNRRKDEFLDDLDESKDELGERLENAKDELLEHLDESKDELIDKFNKALAERKEQKAQKEQKRLLAEEKRFRLSNHERYLLRSFPQLKPTRSSLEDILSQFRDEIKRRKAEKK